MRILFFTPENVDGSGSSRVRVIQYFEHFNKSGIKYDLEPFVDKIFQRLYFKKGVVIQARKVLLFFFAFLRRVFAMVKAYRYDLVFIHRYIFPFGPAVFEFILKKVLRKKIIYDFDDAIFLPIKTEANSFVSVFKLNPIKTRQIVQLSDRVIAGNQYLKEYASQFNLRTTVIPSVINVNEYDGVNITKESNQKKLVIGWIGSHGTSPYLEKYLDLFLRLSNKFTRVEFNLVGYQGIINHPRFRVLPWSLADEKKMIKSFDIGINPMPDDNFTRGKCGFKIVQYMGAGIPSVVSPIGANKEIVVDGETGFFATTEEEWLEKLSILLENGDLREKMGKAARQRAAEIYDVSVAFPKLLEVIGSCQK